jgi:hypothetical protein
MPPIDVPRIRRLDANALLISRDFVLRRGMGQRLVLTVRSDAGLPMHLRLRYEAASDTYWLRAPRWLDGTLYKLRMLYNQPIAADELVTTLTHLLRPAVPAPMVFGAAEAAVDEVEVEAVALALSAHGDDVIIAT